MSKTRKIGMLLVVLAFLTFGLSAVKNVRADYDEHWTVEQRPRYRKHYFRFYYYNIQEMKNSYSAAWNNAHSMVWTILEEEFPFLGDVEKGIVAGIVKPIWANSLRNEVRYTTFQPGQTMVVGITVDRYAAGVSQIASMLSQALG